MAESTEFKQYQLPEPEGAPVNPDVATQQDLGSISGLNQLDQGYLKSGNYVPSTAGWILKPDGAEINGGVSVSSLNIPDTTTANSFHTDSSGNSWWGANVASGYANANARILADGSAVFKNVQIGGSTIQYVITNSGIFSFGDGSDGNATADGSTAVTGMSRSGSVYTMTRDVYFNNFTINSGVTVNPAGYRVFVKDTLTVAGTLARNGNDGGIGGNGSQASNAGPNGAGGGSAGAALSDGYLKGSPAGTTGGSGGSGGAQVIAAANGNSSSAGTNTLNSLGSDGVGGGTGGTGGNGSAAGGKTPGSGGAAGTVTLSNVKLIANWHLATLLDISSTGSTVKFTGSASGTGGGGGGGGGTTLSGPSGGGSGSGGGGGGSGSPSGIVAIYARTIVISATGVISANGGAGGAGGIGGNGGVASDPNDGVGGGGGGGGGAGGNGGILVMAYNNLTNSGSIAANGGAGGAGGAGGTGAQSGSGTFTNGSSGSTGSTGSAGVIYQFQLSL